jgi:hypothetical protein
MKQTLRRPILIETMILVAICVIDTAHTLAIIKLGLAREANPVVAWTFAHGDGVFVGFKLGSASAIVAALEHIRTYRDPFVKAAIRAGIALYLGVYAIGSLGLFLARH